MHDWKKIAAKIGPLRYQASESDCVPTTIVNGLIFLLQRRIHPRLLQMIWSVSIESKHGTGWVTARTLSDILNSWFQVAAADGYEDDVMPYESRVIEGDSVHLARNNALVRAINAGGICCLMVGDGTHYILLHAMDGRDFLAFAPYWKRRKGAVAQRELNDEYFGLVNTRFTRDELIDELTNDYNKWVQIITPVHVT